MSSLSNSHKLLSEVSKTVEIFGDEGTIDILKKATTRNHKNKHIEFVIKMVCERFNFDPHYVIGRSRNSKRILATRFICYYAYAVSNPPNKKGKRGESEICYTDIGNRIKRHARHVRNYHDEMELNKKNKTHACQPYFKEFDDKIKSYLKSTK